ncbi:STAS domain-containing protein [Streptomyces sp. NPDC048106]|uniref:STAS domain-containing protein n=1 Tax=Streptomyces sp. NPDC048106 TaxID=3155750 RepID=UPI00345270B0
MEHGRPSPARVRPGGTAPLLLRTAREPRADGCFLSVLSARGTVDASNAASFSDALAAHVTHAERAGEHPVLDLTEVYLDGAAALHALDRVAGPLARTGRALAVVQPRPHVRETLHTTVPRGLCVHASLAAALHPVEPTGPQHPGTAGRADSAAPADPAPHSSRAASG